MGVEGELRVLKRGEGKERCRQREREREAYFLLSHRAGVTRLVVYDCVTGAHSQSHRSADEAEWKAPAEAALSGKD